VIGELLNGGMLEDKLQRAYLRPTDGSDAVRIAAGYPEDISPDGRLIAVVMRTGGLQLTVVPVGPGETAKLPTESLAGIGELNFLPDGKRLVYAAVEKGRPGRIFVQDLAGGPPRPISSEGVATDGHATPDGKYVIGKSQDVFALYPIEGGDPRPVKGLTANDMPLQFRVDGRLWVRRLDSWPPDVDVVDLETGNRQLWKTVQPIDFTGVDMMGRIVITPDGRSYCYDHVRFLSDLFVVEGIR
jgi:dipeptidyl aminopeptidase/acylaminoacyl peptidase